MIYHMLIAVAGVVGLMMIWVGVQTVVRRNSVELPGDADVLACRSCSCSHGTPEACGECAHASRLESN